jgi:2-polyprenyl-3-methyl-5-hydroxy-6-metoxy-1,4-benzoquinol methylase
VEQALVRYLRPGDICAGTTRKRMTEKIRHFPCWEQKYQEVSVTSMPWFSSVLDPDLEEALSALNLRAGTFLDVGTGPGTQAMRLAERGFQVTATDISNTAVKLAEETARRAGLDITWQQDDVLNTCLRRRFDAVFDRGCFNVLAPQQRSTYLAAVANLVKPGAYLFLKCFSEMELSDEGPYRFSPERIREIFGERFVVESVKETVFQGTVNPPPRALFCVLKLKGDDPHASGIGHS